MMQYALICRRSRREGTRSLRAATALVLFLVLAVGSPASSQTAPAESCSDDVELGAVDLPWSGSLAPTSQDFDFSVSPGCAGFNQTSLRKDIVACFTPEKTCNVRLATIINVGGDPPALDLDLNLFGGACNPTPASCAASASNGGFGHAVIGSVTLQGGTHYCVVVGHEDNGGESLTIDVELQEVLGLDNDCGTVSGQVPLATPTLPTPPTLLEPDVVVFTSQGGLVSENPGADLSEVLSGDLSQPGGNIELGTRVELLDNDAYKHEGYSQCLQGTVGGKSLQICTLTSEDWESDLDGNGKTLLTDIADQFVSFYGLGGTVGAIVRETTIMAFKMLGGRQRFSGGANVSYANVDPHSGKLKIGLAGHLNAMAEIQNTLEPIGLAGMVPDITMASEIVKVIVDGQTSYQYSFDAVPSHQSNGAGDNFDATYEIVLLADDIDGDGVPNSAPDACPSTPSGTIVDPASGCSIAQSCPCKGPQGTTELWKNHGDYVSCVNHSAQRFVDLGFMTEAEKDATVSAAAQSGCGL